LADGTGYAHILLAIRVDQAVGKKNRRLAKPLTYTKLCPATNKNGIETSKIRTGKNYSFLKANVQVQAAYNEMGYFSSGHY
jgi:hypothetical protein